ncbi:MAG: hypothetical protein PHS88_11920, partial [Candidatus Omnitrophica bacterium]|nr:hypothetical protein [Candidatus Omnitrophota bacterium]
MKVALLDLAGDGRPYVCKDLAGGFGTKLVIGPSLRAKWLEWVKTRCVRLPVMAYGYLAAIFRLAKHNVEYIQNDLERAAKADMVFTWTSLVEYEREREAVRESQKRGAPSVGVI